MKIKSRIIAMVLCIVSIVSLAACGEKTAEIKPAETEGAQAAAVGTILSEPEKTTADIGKRI